jgi:hypothetical protein
VSYAEKTGVLMAVRSDSGVPGVIEMTPYRTTVEWEESALVAFEKGYVKPSLELWLKMSAWERSSVLFSLAPLAERALAGAAKALADEARVQDPI